MTQGEFGQLMKVLADNFGNMGEGIYGTWYQVLGNYQYQEVKVAFWDIVHNMKTRPKVADVLEAMGKSGSGGGSTRQEPTGCDFCGGSGWAHVELREPVRVFIPWLKIDELRPQISSMRCVCDRGNELNPKYDQLTTQIIRDRWLNLVGELRRVSTAAQEREVKLRSMDQEQVIRWAKKGMQRMEANR